MVVVENLYSFGGELPSKLLNTLQLFRLVHIEEEEKIIEVKEGREKYCAVFFIDLNS